MQKSAVDVRSGQHTVAVHPCSWWPTVFQIMLLAACLGCGVSAFADENKTDAAAKEPATDVTSVLVRRCLECHQPGKASGNLALATIDGILQGGDSGPAIVPGQPEKSLLLNRVVAGEMPPAKQGHSQQLPESEMLVLRRWIEGGAAWPKDKVLDLYERTSDVRGGRDWWSLQPLKKVEPPRSAANIAGNSTGDSVNPIDKFVGSKLQAAGMTAAPQATPRERIRRVYSVLSGLPPSAEAITAFERDPSPEAYARVVDDLLASPQFGVRWARHWLDVARFAETSGYERDQTKPYAWKYRDWVVDAFNDDLPFDQFIRYQIAGDEVPERSETTVIATGFLRLGTWNDEPNDPADYTYERLEDLVHATSSAFLALSVKCARCHDHKFDPIPQVDYYRIASAFWTGPVHAGDRALLGGPSQDALGFEQVLGWTDITKSPNPLHVLRNGDRAHPMQPAEPGPLSCLQEQNMTFQPSADAAARTTGLRLQLADWIASPENPLPPRVIVNRLWQHHFGEGIVRSANNFGFTGDLPSHPELLDWLAGELIRGGWKLKPLHRLIVTSAAFQQSSLHPHQDEYRERDAQNSLLWRAHRRRLDAESLRDAFLAATGELDSRTGGPSFKPTISDDALEGLSRKASAWEASPRDEQNRRSLYMFSQRSLMPPLMTTFDQCDTTLPCEQRDVTTVAPQALTLLNNEFVHDRAETLAAGIVRAGTVDRDRAAAAWLAVLRRPPTDEECALALEHVSRQLARFTAQTTEQIPAVPETGSDRSGTDSSEGKIWPNGLVLHLDAGQGVEKDSQGRVERWVDQSGSNHHARQIVAQHRPASTAEGLNGQPALQFSGQQQFLQIEGSLLVADRVSIFAVVTDNGQAGHREILSNWSGRDGNSVSSVFVGLTSENTVRFSDSFADAGRIRDREKPFLLTVTNGDQGAAVFQQRLGLAKQSARLPGRKFGTPWVIGQQGNIDGEYWNGLIAELLVFDRQLTESEREVVWSRLISRYQLEELREQPRIRASPEVLAWASLCLVLFNSNEFIYVD